MSKFDNKINEIKILRDNFKKQDAINMFNKVNRNIADFVID